MTNSAKDSVKREITVIRVAIALYAILILSVICILVYSIHTDSTFVISFVAKFLDFIKTFLPVVA